MLKKHAYLIFLMAILCLPAWPVAAAGFIPDCAITGNGNCDICHILYTAIYIFKWALGLLGGAALVLFVWHGFSLIISGGQAEKIEKAKKGLAHTLIGLAIVFGSWMIVNVVIITLTDPQKLLTGGAGTIFSGQAWNEFCK